MDGITEIKAAELRSAAVRLSAGGRHPLAAMFGRDETCGGAGYAIYCLFEIPEERRMAVLKAIFPVDGELSYESLTPVLPAAAWYEREIRDMFGIVPLGHPDPRPLVLHESFPRDFHPLRKSVAKDAQVWARDAQSACGTW